VIGLEKALGSGAKVSLEGFIKRRLSVSINDGISLANKGAGFEVLGNETVATIE
jgi:hypothetical protein